MNTPLADNLREEAHIALQSVSREADQSPLSHSILRIPVTVQVVIGSVRLPLSQLAELATGSVLPLDQELGAPATVLVNGREVASGELFVQDGMGDRLCVRFTEIKGIPQPQAK